jgi:rSAM/selenodomain-associated transferase 1
MRHDSLIIFLKAPRPGAVKTRLARSIGAAEACAAYRTLVEMLLDSLSSLGDVTLRFAPDEARSEISDWLRPGWQAQPQGPGDLGQRLEAAFDDAFNAGAHRVVIIGSDCPDVSVEDARAAWGALVTHEVVLGPAEDGGYWLIGLRGMHRELLQGIPWSTSQVLPQTLQRARAANLRVHLLRPRTDIDTEAEWRTFCARQSRLNRY